MAMCVTNVFKNHFSRLGKSVINQCILNLNRQLYTPSAMGIDKYINIRNQVKTQFLNVDELFRQKMRDFVDKDKDSMIFTEDLKTMLHLVQKVPDDIDLLIKMIKKFNSQTELRFGSYIFGPVVMRAFYHLDEPDLALSIFKDPEMKDFFDQLMSYQLLLDMLYNHGRYQDIMEVYDIIKTRNTDSIVHPKNAIIITIAACYKENTPESFQYALTLWKDLVQRGAPVLRRALIFLGALALNQHAPHIALEIISGSKSSQYIDIRCLKIAAYIELGRLDEVAVMLRTSLRSDNPSMRKQKYFKDTIEMIDKAIVKEKLDDTSELVKLAEQIKLHDFVQDVTMEKHINLPIEAHQFTEPFTNSNYQKQNQNYMNNRQPVYKYQQNQNRQSNYQNNYAGRNRSFNQGQ